MTSTSWNPEETSEGAFTQQDGFTDILMDEANRITEKRIPRTKSIAQPKEIILSKEHRSLLFPVVKILMEQVKVCREIEHQRLKLSHTKDFNLPHLYKLFSTNKQVTLAKHEFVKG